MQTIDALSQVADFHRTFHHPILEKPQIPSQKRSELRVSLIEEELREFEEAIAAKDIVEVADALCDIQYVLAGAILEFGLGDKFVELFNEVQRSNMSKACKTEDDAKATVAHYEAKGFPCEYEKDGDKFLVFRTADRKTLKSVSYSPADLKTILEK